MKGQPFNIRKIQIPGTAAAATLVCSPILDPGAHRQIQLRFARSRRRAALDAKLLELILYPVGIEIGHA